MYIVITTGIPITESIVQIHYVDTEYETKVGNIVQYVQLNWNNKKGKINLPFLFFIYR